MGESQEHKLIKNKVLKKLKEWYGVANTEYSHVGHRLDVYCTTPDSLMITVEIIWSASRADFHRDMSLIQQSDATIKIVIVNPQILKKKEMCREYMKIRQTERKRGYILSELLPADKFLKNGDYLNIDFKLIVEDLQDQVRQRKYSVNVDKKLFEHSKKLVKKGILPWIKHMESPTQISIAGVETFEDHLFGEAGFFENKLFYHEFKDTINEYFDIVQCHLKSGYESQWRAYQLIKENSRKYGQNILAYIESLKKAIVEIVRQFLGDNISEYNYFCVKPSGEYYSPLLIAQVIYDDLKRVVASSNNLLFKKECKIVPLNMEKGYYCLQREGGHCLIRSANKKALEETKNHLAILLETKKLINDLKKIKKHEKQLKKRFKDFLDFLKGLKQQIDLSEKPLSGSCKYCQHLT